MSQPQNHQQGPYEVKSDGKGWFKVVNRTKPLEPCPVFPNEKEAQRQAEIANRKHFDEMGDLPFRIVP